MGGELVSGVQTWAVPIYVAIAAGTEIATFTDSNATDAATGFTASINWGDGTTTAGTVSGSNGSFTVAAGTGGHTYSDQAAHAVSVSLNRTPDNRPGTPTSELQSTEHHV